MKISTLIDELQRIHSKHGDVHVSGAHVPGQPEMTIHSIHYVAPGPLVTAAPHNRQDELPKRVLIDWKIA